MIYGIDYKEFHPDCGDLEILQTSKGTLLHCKKCRVMVDIAVAGKRISHSDGKKVGKVDRDEFHYTSIQKAEF